MDKDRRQYQRQYREQYKSQAKRVNLTFSNEEHRAFSRAAKAGGEKLTPFIKKLALSALQKQALIPTEIQEELKTVKFAIRNIANNVNQIAHHSNIVFDLTRADENNLLQYLKQLEEVVEAYTQGRILQAKESNNDN